jgi:hypothetical protein
VDSAGDEYQVEHIGRDHRIGAKVRQWRENPYSVDGYVVVVGFATREVIFSFNRFEEQAR